MEGVMPIVGFWVSFELGGWNGGWWVGWLGHLVD
jgi:hypothetical protein